MTKPAAQCGQTWAVCGGSGTVPVPCGTVPVPCGTVPRVHRHARGPVAHHFPSKGTKTWHTRQTKPYLQSKLHIHFRLLVLKWTPLFQYSPLSYCILILKYNLIFAKIGHTYTNKKSHVLLDCRRYSKISKTFANVSLKIMYFRRTFANVLLFERSPVSSMRHWRWSRDQTSFLSSESIHVVCTECPWEKKGGRVALDPSF